MKRHGLNVAMLLIIVPALVMVGGGCGEKAAVVETEPKTAAAQPETSPKSPPVNKQVTLYFLKGETPTAVTRTALIGKDRTPAEVALEELLKGPTGAEQQQGLTTAIPAGTRLLSYGAEGEESTAQHALASFSKELKNFGGGSARVKAITDQIKRTITSNEPGVTGIDIEIEGVPAEESLQP